MTKDILKKINIWGIVLVLFLPLFSNSSFIFPFMSAKNFAFRFIILLLLIILAWRLINIKKIRLGLIFTLFIVFFLVQILSAIFGMNFYYSVFGNYERIDGIFNYFVLLLYLLTLINTFTFKKDWQILFRALSVSSLLMFIFYFLGLNGLRFHFILLDNSGTIGNTAFFGSYVTLSLFLLLIAYFYDENKKWKYFYIFNILLSIIILFINASRGSILGLIIGALVTLFYLGFKSKKSIKYLSIGLLTALILFGFLIVNNKDKSWVQNTKFLNRFATISSQEASSYNRLLIWKVGYRAFLDRPILGYGPENILYGVNKYFNPQITEDWFDRMHNFVFDYLDSSGILGLLSYLGIFVGALIIILKSRKNNDILTSLFLGFLSSYLFLNLFIFDTINSWILVIFFLAFIYFYYKEHNDPKDEFQISKFIQNKESLFIGLTTTISMFLIYIFVFLPMQANLYGLKALAKVDSDPTKALDYLEKAISLNTFGNRELILQMSKMYTENIADKNDVEIQFKKQLFEESEKNLLSIIKKDPGDVRTRFVLGELYLKYSAYNTFYIQEAINLLEGTIQYSPNRVEVYTMLAQGYLLKGDPEKSLEYLEKVVQINYSREQDYLNIINVLSQMKNKELLDQYVNMFSEKFPNTDSENYRKIGQYYFMGGYFDDAQKILLEKAIPRDPNNMKNYVSLASIYEYQKQYDKTISYIQNVISSHKEWSQTLEDYITYLKSLKQ